MDAKYCPSTPQREALKREEKKGSQAPAFAPTKWFDNDDSGEWMCLELCFERNTNFLYNKKKIAQFSLWSRPESFHLQKPWDFLSFHLKCLNDYTTGCSIFPELFYSFYFNVEFAKLFHCKRQLFQLPFSLFH
jgi:hypothetical protein